MPEINADKFEYTFKAMGYYRVFFSSIIQFNSIVVRVVVGILIPDLALAVATITALEFSLNAALEVPLGRFADRFGRIPSAITGLFMIILGLLCMFAAALVESTALSTSLIYIDGMLLGFGKPLYSGSVEAFYQSNLERYSSDLKEHTHQLEQSFILSGQFGKVIPTVAVIAAFGLIYWLHQYQLSLYAISFGALLYLFNVCQLIRDSRYLGDLSIECHGSSRESFRFKQLLQLIINSPTAKLSIALKFIAWVFLSLVLGYCLIAIGRQYLPSDESNRYFWFLVSFMLGFMTLGWYLRASWLVSFAKNRSNRFLVLFGLGLHALINILACLLLPVLPPVALVIFLFLYMSIFQVADGALQNLSINLMLKSVPEARFSEALSIQNIPAYLFMGVYSSYFAFYSDGAPRLQTIFSTCLVVALLGLVVFSRQWMCIVGPIRQQP